MPAFNSEDTIEESVTSILNENLTMGDEIIIVDDGSTDNTAAIISAIKNKVGPIIRIIKHSKNLGGGAARNSAVENAKNQLIFCLDSDNLLLPRSMSILRNEVQDGKHDIYAFQYVSFFNKDNTSITHKWKFKPSVHTFEDCIATSVHPISSGNYLYSKKSWKKVGGYPQNMKALDAWSFGFKQMATGHSMKIIEGTSYQHRFGHNSYWKREENSDDINKLAFNVILPYLDMFSHHAISYLLDNLDGPGWFQNLDIIPLTSDSEALSNKGEVIFKNRMTTVKFQLYTLYRKIKLRVQV